jgi:hypothetical protein
MIDHLCFVCGNYFRTATAETNTYVEAPVNAVD